MDRLIRSVIQILVFLFMREICLCDDVCRLCCDERNIGRKLPYISIIFCCCG
jgi:hypothetical protein